MIKPIFGYPGGKSNALGQIFPQLPLDFTEYREVFGGGASVALNVTKRFPGATVWYNDLGPVSAFWATLQKHPSDLLIALKAICETTKTVEAARALFNSQLANDSLDIFERAVRFYVLNRLSFGGLGDGAKFSPSHFTRNDLEAPLLRLPTVANIIKGWRITSLDYREVLATPGADVLIFADPPYLAATKHKLYGKLHTDFDHGAFASAMRNCPHRWLITYDDSPEIRANFVGWARLTEWKMIYVMQRMIAKKRKGNELFIANYAKAQNLLF